MTRRTATANYIQCEATPLTDFPLSSQASIRSVGHDQRGHPVGVTLRIVRARGDATAGALAVVETVRQSRSFVEWCLPVRWHHPPPNKRALHRDTRLNLVESELLDFGIFTRSPPLSTASFRIRPASVPSCRRRKGILPVSHSPQLALPYIAHECVTDRVGDEWIECLPEAHHRLGLLTKCLSFRRQSSGPIPITISISSAIQAPLA
jgi:hypothetical protein